MQQIDDAFAPFLQTIQDRQAAYFATHGHYFQGLPLAVDTPEVGTQAAIDPNRQPTDLAHTWASVAADVLPANISVQVSIDVYSSSQGWGYVVRLSYKLNGDTYRKSINVGWDVSRDHDWVADGATG